MRRRIAATVLAVLVSIGFTAAITAASDVLDAGAILWHETNLVGAWRERGGVVAGDVGGNPGDELSAPREGQERIGHGDFGAGARAAGQVGRSGYSAGRPRFSR